MHKKSLLTIAIPTYNRSESLEYIVGTLLSYLTNDIRLLIIDNNSSDSTYNYCTKIAKQSEYISVIKNSSNLGGVVNMLRCIEFSNSTYTWLLGDDDDIDVGLLTKLLKELETEEHYSYHIIPRSRINRKIRQYTFVDKEDFINNFYDITAIHLMSSNIYHTKKAQEYLSDAYRLVHLQHAFTLFHAKFLEENCSLKIINLPIMKPERLQIKRWSKFTAHLDALETTFCLFADKLTNKEYLIRKRELFRISITSLFIQKDEGFNISEVKRLFRIISLKNFSMPLLLYIILLLKSNRYSSYLIIYSIYLTFILKYKSNYKSKIVSYFDITENEKIMDYFINNINKNKFNFFKN